MVVTMIFLRLFFFFFHFLVQISTLLAQPDFLERVCSNQNGNYTTNSTYEANLHTIFSSLSNLPSTAQYSGGFYNLSARADSSDRANAIVLCRGDVTPEACYSCLNDSIHELTKQCPNQKEAIGWYDYCMFRYSDNSIFGVMNTRPGLPIWSPTNVTSDVGLFNDVLSRLLNSLARTAATGGLVRKFATGNASVTNIHTIYALVQCTPDLTHLECQTCLAEAFSEMANYFHGKVGGRILRRSCNFQYDNRVFYNTTPSTDGPGNDQTSHQSITVTVVPIAVAMVLIICIGLGISTFLKLRKRREKVEGDSKGSKAVDEVRSAESLEFEFGTIRDATNNFSDANKLGQGGFGAVYKGRLSDGQEIAVKRLSKESGQGDIEFKNEVLLVAKLQHRNLVRLLGFCLESDERLLVYEFVPNTSLDNFIFDLIKREHLNWEMRYKVIGGTVRGLVYLHEDSHLRIIHRDLKASNILLDADMNPKIADFGMARLFIRDQTHGSTRRIVGTYGYMAPEYIMHGHFSVKSDVYSFGVLVLEIVSGQKNNSFRDGENVEDLLSYAWRNWKEGTAVNVIDPGLRSSSVSEMMGCIHIALLCVQHNVDDRPTMTSIAGMLNSYSLTLPVPSQPVFFANSSMDSLNMPSSQGLSESAQSSFQELRPQ